MSDSVRILSISDDDGLRLSRELLIANDGYETESDFEQHRRLRVLRPVLRYRADLQICPSRPGHGRCRSCRSPR